MSFVLYAALVVFACVAIGVSLLAQDRRKQKVGKLEDLQRRAKVALATGNDQTQRAAVGHLLKAAEPLFFKGVRGWAFYFQIALFLVFVGGGFLALWWGVSGAVAEWQVHQAAPCRGRPRSTCLLSVPGTIVGKDVGGHANYLWVETVAGTMELNMWGDIHPIGIGEAVRVETLDGAAVYVDTHEGRIEVDAYISQMTSGLIFGLMLPVSGLLGLWHAARQRATYAEWQGALEKFPSQS